MAVFAVAHFDLFGGTLVVGGVIMAIGNLAIHTGINRIHHVFFTLLSER